MFLNLKRYGLVVVGRREKLFSSNKRQVPVDWLRVVVQRRSFAQDQNCTHNGRDREYPQEQSVQHHGHETPVLIFLYENRNVKTESISEQYKYLK